MAKLLNLINALLTVEAHKALATEVQAELGDLANLDAKEFAARIAKGDDALKQNGELVKATQELEDKAKGADALKAIVNGYETRDRDAVVSKVWVEAAKKAGISDAAIETARKLADLSKIKVDAANGTVEGIGDELFAGLKKDHPVLFTPPVAAVAAPAAIPALPPAGGGAVAADKAPEISGPVGLFMAAAKMADAKK